MSTYEDRMQAALLKQIKVELVERGLAQKDLAAKLDIDTATMSRYLTGKTQMSMAVFYRFAEGLGMSPAELMSRTAERAQ